MSATRPPRPDEAILGVAPAAVAEPATPAEAAELLAEAARRKLAVAFLGGGTDLGVGAPPRALDLLVRTSRLARVVEHLPADQIVVAEAGLPLAALQRALAAHGQRLALDPPWPERATIGGVVAANAFGPLRTRHGAARDLIVGASLVRADGVAARGGGKVVKNVAGFDLPRLLVGSLGTLALLTSVTFRLHPLPEASRTVAVEGPAAAGVRALVQALREAQLEPASAMLLLDGGAARLGVRFEGFGPGVEQQAGRLAGLASRLGLRPEPLDAAAAAAFWSHHDALRGRGTLRLRLAAPPRALVAVADEVLAPLAAALDGAWATFDPITGTGYAGGTPSDPPRAVAALRAARAAIEARRGAATLAAAPPEVRAGFDPWGAPPASLEVMRRLKARLDPEGRLAPGRFVGGL